MVIIARTPFTLSAPIIVVTVPALRGRIRARVHRAARARSRASLRCGLVVEHEAARIEGLCELDKPAPQLLDRRLRLLHGGGSLFSYERELQQHPVHRRPVDAPARASVELPGDLLVRKVGLLRHDCPHHVVLVRTARWVPAAAGLPLERPWRASASPTGEPSPR
jgi:hypothetical protein